MTVARRMTRETAADCTPGTAESAASTAPLQAEQCIPPTSTSMVCRANYCQGCRWLATACPDDMAVA